MPETKNVEYYRWEDMEKEPLMEGLSRRMVSGEKGMVAQVFLKKGTEVPKHSHHNEQYSYIMSGALRFWFGEDESEERVVRAGEIIIIPAHLPHKAIALEDTLDLDIFVPPREDWLNKTDHYLRGGG